MGEIVVLLPNWKERLRGHLEMFAMRKLLFITVILHLGCLATVLADSWKSYVQHETEIGSDLNWKEQVIEVLEELLGEKVRTPPAPEVVVGGRRLNWDRAQTLSGQINATRTGAQNIIAHIREINETASQILWETSAKSARYSRKLAEEVLNITRMIVQGFSRENIVDVVESQLKADVVKTMKMVSRFHESHKLTDAVLMKVKEDNVSELSKLHYEIEDFRRKAKLQLDRMRESAQNYIDQTIKYLNLGQNYTSFPSEAQSNFEVIAATTKAEAISFVRTTSAICLGQVQEMFEKLKDASQKPKQLEQTLKVALNKTKLEHSKTIETWTQANHKAMAISRSTLKYQKIQSILKKTKHSIEEVKEGIKNAQLSNRIEAIKDNLENMSECVTEVVKTASELSVFRSPHKFHNFDFEQTMYAMWAQFYGSRAKRRVWRVREFISSSDDLISREYQTNPVESSAKEGLEASVQKLNEALSYEGQVAEISVGVVEEATREMKHNVDLVQMLFHATDVKAKVIVDKYKEQWFKAFREADAIMSNTNLAILSTRDQIIEEAIENYRKTNVLVLEAKALRKWTHFVVPLSAFLVSACIITAFSVFICKKRLQGHHTYLVGIKTEEDLMKLSKRQMKEVLGMSGVVVREEANQEEIQELLKQLWLHREHNPSLVPVKYTEEDEDWSKCKVCMDADIDSVILDCGHLVACNQCGKKLNECPICRQHVAEVLQVVPVSELDLDRLTSKEIKQVFALCGVSFKDRVTARRTLEEWEILKEKQKCQVCTNNLMDSVFLPCGHMMTCTCCGLKLVNCPICKKKIAKVKKIYRA